MFHENLKTLRKARGYSQEQLASQLHIVRQTVSKWEKGLSVPDADMLVKLADILETSVSALLGTPIETEDNQNQVAQQLGYIAEQMAVKNRRDKRVWKTIALILGLLILWQLAQITLGAVYSFVPSTQETATQTLDSITP